MVDLVTCTQAAKRLGVHRGTLAGYANPNRSAAAHVPFPEPVVTGPRRWEWAHILAWHNTRLRRGGTVELPEPTRPHGDNTGWPLTLGRDGLSYHDPNLPCLQPALYVHGPEPECAKTAETVLFHAVTSQLRVVMVTSHPAPTWLDLFDSTVDTPETTGTLRYSRWATGIPELDREQRAAFGRWLHAKAGGGSIARTVCETAAISSRTVEDTFPRLPPEIRTALPATPATHRNPNLPSPGTVHVVILDNPTDRLLATELAARHLHAHTGPTVLITDQISGQQTVPTTHHTIVVGPEPEPGHTTPHINLDSQIHTDRYQRTAPNRPVHQTVTGP